MAVRIQKVTVQAMKAHIEFLCSENDIKLYHYTGGGRALKPNRAIYIKEIKGAKTYAVALHEIGHHMAKGGFTLLLVEREFRCWQWAKQHAIVWTEGMQAKMIDCLSSYITKAGNSTRVILPGKTERRALWYSVGLFKDNDNPCSYSEIIDKVGGIERHE